MKQKIKLFFALVSAAIAALLPAFTFAHENYVLPQSQIYTGMHDWSINVFDALKNAENVRIALAVALGSAIAIILYFFFQKSEIGREFDAKIKKLEPFGHVLLRVALGASFIASAMTYSYLGPELHISTIPPGMILRPIVFALGVLMLIGLFDEIVGALALLTIISATLVYKDYMLTYFNYYGEFLALMFFGSHVLSLDRVIWGKKKISAKLKNLEIAIIRVTYGISILYPAISIKLLHPKIIIDIINQYHINKFHWLFPHDPLLIALGTGFAQVAVGICLIFGFETRLNTFVTFTLMLMSVLFFREAVWPHYILLALALYLIINNGGDYSIDHYILNKFKKRKAVVKSYK